MRDDAREEKRSGGVRHVFGRISEVRQEVSSVVQRHKDHNESTQDVH